MSGPTRSSRSARSSAQYGGVYITHLRSEADGFLEGLEEAIEIGRRANVAVEIYHLKAAGRRELAQDGRRRSQRIERARAAGLDVTADMYPYIAGGTGLSSVLPPWAAADGRLYDNLRDPAMRAQDPRGGAQPLRRLGGDGRAQLGRTASCRSASASRRTAQYTGMRLSEIAADARHGLARHRDRPARRGGASASARSTS